MELSIVGRLASIFGAGIVLSVVFGFPMLAAIFFAFLAACAMVVLFQRM